MMLLSGSLIVHEFGAGSNDGRSNGDPLLDPLSHELVSYGYRTRFAYPGSPFIQTPSPAPEGAVVHPYGWTPAQTASTPPTRATWTQYYAGTVLTVYIDTSSAGGGNPTSQEEALLDTIIADFNDFTFPRVKDWYDPLNRITEAVYYVYKIDGPSGTGGYYQPGTDQFYVDRDDMSWAGEITAHEFQHYVHDQYDMYEDLWINEGCADHAAYLVYGFAGVLSGHLAIYLQYYPQTTLPVSNYGFQSDGTTRYYGIAFAYQLFMTHQYGMKNWSRALIRSTQSGSGGVNAALSNLGFSDRFQESYEKWMVGSRLNDPNVDQGQYSYAMQTYPYGNLRTEIMASFNSFPVSSSKPLNAWGPQSFRFTAPGDSDTFRLKLALTDGDMIAAFFPEKSSYPRNVTFIAKEGTSLIYDFSGWGVKYGAFQLIVSSSAGSTLSIDLDVLDLVPPVTTPVIDPIRPDGNDGWYISAPWVTLKTEAGASTFYSLDLGPTTQYTAPVYITDGDHNLSFWSVDSRDNVESPRYLDFKVDTQIPTTSVDVDPNLSEDKWYTEAPTITMHTSHPRSRIVYRWDQGPFQNYTAAFAAPEGEHTLFWRAMDQAGNEEGISSRSFMVDTVQPVVRYDISPPEPDGLDGWYLKEPVVSLSGDPNDIIYYALDNLEYSRYITSVRIPEGSHAFRAISVDPAGNDAQEVHLSFKVDTVTPSVSAYFQNFAYSIDNASSWFDANPILTLEGSEDRMTMNYSINNGPYIDYINPLQFEDGANEVRIDGADEAGNRIEPLYFLIKLDTRNPNVAMMIEPGAINGWYTDPSSMLELNLVSEGENASPATIRYQWNDGDVRTYRDPVRIPEGRNSLTYQAEDSAGNSYQPKTVEIKKDTILPDISMKLVGATNRTITIGETLIVDMSGSSDESLALFYQVDFGDGNNTSFRSSPTFDHIYTQSGTYTLVGTVRDSAGNEAMVEMDLTVTKESVAPLPKDEGSNMGLIIGAALLALIMLLVIAALMALILVRRRGFEVIEPEAVPIAQVAPPTNPAVPTSNGAPPPPVMPKVEE
jgi:PKD repeat protein